MKKLHQRAIELADMIETTPYAKSVLAGQISQAIDEAREAALEEAARAATLWEEGDAVSGNGYGDGRRDAAAKIRALEGK